MLHLRHLLFFGLASFFSWPDPDPDFEVSVGVGFGPSAVEPSLLLTVLDWEDFWKEMKWNDKIKQMIKLNKQNGKVTFNRNSYRSERKPIFWNFKSLIFGRILLKYFTFIKYFHFINIKSNLNRTVYFKEVLWVLL